MENVLRPYLENLERFDEEEINAIVDHTQSDVFQKGDIILNQGEICTKCYFVIKGCLRQYKLVDGEEKTTGFFLEGQPVVSYSSYLQKKPSEFNLSCEEDCVLVIGDRDKELELHQKYPKLGELTFALMLQDYKKAENYIALLNTYKPEDRYLMLLKNQPELLHRVPLHHIASFIGVTPESFSRIRKRVTNKRLKKQD